MGLLNWCAGERTIKLVIQIIFTKNIPEVIRPVTKNPLARVGRSDPGDPSN